MAPNPFLGVFLHAIGGFAAGSFYAPLKEVRRWAWESFWLVMGVAAWLAAPWMVALITTPHLLDVLRGSPRETVMWCILFGMLWGIGGLTFGLTMRYLGVGLGMAVALGFCMTIGALTPPIFKGFFGTPEDKQKLVDLFTTLPGMFILGGVVVCLGGIALCGWAGICKERELTDEQKKETVAEFALGKGFAVAVVSGVLSACFAFGLAAGKPIADLAVKAGTKDIFSNNVVLIVVLIGGFTTNAIWCLILNAKNRSFGDYVTGPAAGQLLNYFFSALGGVIWYGQFFFYGMGTTKLGKEYDFSSWSIHMAFIIVFSNLWGIVFHEWRGTSRRAKTWVWTGILILILSTVVTGYGNYLAAQKKKEEENQKNKDAAGEVMEDMTTIGETQNENIMAIHDIFIETRTLNVVGNALRDVPRTVDGRSTDTSWNVTEAFPTMGSGQTHSYPITAETVENNLRE